MRYIPYTLCLAALTLTSSCIYPTMHFADRANSPGFTEKGEFKAIAAVKPQAADPAPFGFPGAENFSSSGVAPELDLAYSLTNHFALTAGYTSVVNRYTLEGSVPDGWGREDSSVGGMVNLNGLEIGGGYFLGGPGVFRFGAYGNVGIGSLTREGLVLPEFNYKSRYWKYSVQPEVGIAPNNGRVFSVMFGARLTGIKYYGFRSGNELTKYAVGYYNPKYPGNVTTGMHFYFEPYANVEVGFKYVKLNVQTGLTEGVTPVASTLGSMPYISLGFAFHYKPSFKDGKGISLPRPAHPPRR